MLPKYTYQVTWSEEDEEYVGLCREFPSLSWIADTQEAALQGIKNVVAEVVLDMESNGETTQKIEDLKKTFFANKQFVEMTKQALNAKGEFITLEELRASLEAKE